LYRFIRSIRGILKLRGGIGKLLPPDFRPASLLRRSWAAPDDESRRVVG
jgi:hypothetical protein